MALPDFDCYAVLEVDRNARKSVIAAAFRVLAREYHPDHNPDADQRRIKRINVAYEVLSDPETREAYDEHLLEAEKTTSGRSRESKSESSRARTKQQERASRGGLVCKRCGKSFRTEGGLAWHNQNRPKCNSGG